MCVEIELDTRGLRCPEPVMMLHRQIRKMAVGDIVFLLATDPATQRDIANFCEFLPHQLLTAEQAGDEFHYRIQKGQR